jgi:Xaa-Pro aminopeptidase
MRNENDLPGDEESAVKRPDEIAKLRLAAHFTQEVLQNVLPVIRPDVSEIDIADEIDFQMNKMGLTPSFDTIVASGENGAQPHAVPSDRKLRSGDMITIDLGCKYAGYCGDMTRTFALGNISEDYKKIYEIVKNAQIAGVQAVEDGIICKNVDAVSRGMIQQAGFGEYFVHGTGHGVGTQVHEFPRINASSNTVLKRHMVVTVEPGIYIKNIGGVRIEDTVVVGGGNFYDFTKELIIL